MRINFYAGPGAGKSTTAAWLFSELKRKQISIELVTEYVKAWATTGRKVNGFDQVYLFGKQMNYEYRFLNSGIKNIVTDSPLLLSSYYAKIYNPDINIAESLANIAREYEKNHPSFNIFLERKDKPYVQAGRYQNLEEAKQIDVMMKHNLIREFQDTNQLVFLDYTDLPAILDAVMQHINK
jgi:hypothetical protein